MSVDVQEGLLTWLKDRGYPLEMKVSRAVQIAEAEFNQSEYYPDPKTGVDREIDVIAWWSDTAEGFNLRITLTVECKGSPAFPWLLFASSGYQRSPRAHHPAMNLMARQVANLTGVETLNKFSFFSERANYSHAVTQAFPEKNKDVCYAAVTGVLAAVESQIEQSDSDAVKRASFDYAEIILPVIVTDAPLFSVALGSSGQITLTEILSGTLVRNSSKVGGLMPPIHVTTFKDLPQFLERTRLDVLEYFATLKANPQALVRAEEVLKKLYSSGSPSSFLTRR